MTRKRIFKIKSREGSKLLFDRPLKLKEGKSYQFTDCGDHVEVVTRKSKDPYDRDQFVMKKR